MSKKKSKSTAGPSKFAKGYITQGANALDSAYGANQGKIQDLTDNTVGMLNPWLSDRLENGDAGVNAARDYGVDVLAGNYLTQNNPYFDDMVSNALDKSTNATQAALGLRGLTGGSDYAGIIADRNAQTATNLAYNDYARERGAMDSAAGRAGQIAAADYLPVSGMLNTLQASTTPVNAASQYAGSLGGLLGGYQTQGQKPSTADSIMDGVGTALGIASIFSDERLKENVEQVGVTDMGLPIYTYNYKGDSVTYMGVMAQEVAETQPEALGPEVGGYMTVNYGAIR